MANVIRVLVLTVLIVGFFSKTAYAISFDERMDREEALLATPDFPMAQSEVKEIISNVNQFISDLIVPRDTKVVWVIDTPVGPHYDKTADQINLPKLINQSTEMFILERSAKELAKYKQNYSGIIMHEYGHAVLHQNLLRDSKEFLRVATLIESAQAKKGKDATVPSEIYLNVQIAGAYSEFFSDVLAYAVTGDPKIMVTATKFLGFQQKDVAYRAFPLKATSTIKRLVEKDIEDADTMSRFFEYTPFSLQRPLIAQFMQNNPDKGAELVKAVYNVILEQSEKYMAKPSDKISLRWVIKDFDASLRKNLGL